MKVTQCLKDGGGESTLELKGYNLRIRLSRKSDWVPQKARCTGWLTSTNKSAGLPGSCGEQTQFLFFSAKNRFSWSRFSRTGSRSAGLKESRFPWSGISMLRAINMVSTTVKEYLLNFWIILLGNGIVLRTDFYNSYTFQVANIDKNPLIPRWRHLNGNLTYMESCVKSGAAGNRTLVQRRW